MNALQRSILDLLKSCLTHEKTQLSADFDWQYACQLGKAHQILPMLYYGALQSEAVVPPAVREYLERAAVHSVFVDQNQLYEIALLREQFLQNGVEFMLLKGVLLKQMYPQTDMRPMGDADILIKTEQYAIIKPIMQQLGYEEVLESDHELVWDKKGALYAELHKRLIPSYNKDYYSYFGDGWRLAQPVEGTEYRMRDEDQFIYLFTHYAKHYRDAGIGIRHLMDLHVFLQAKPTLDWGYVEAELEKLQLLTFCRNSLETIDVWFKGKEDTPMSDFMTDRIFGSGSFGTQENQHLSEGVKTTKTAPKEKVQQKKVLRLIFPSVEVLALKYSILRKMPFLLPFVWIYRWIAALLFKWNIIHSHWEGVKVMTEENVAAYQDELNYVGLDFNFEE